MDEHIEAALMEAGARINALAANERRLIDELAKARKDARRYRWLRGGHGSAAAAQHEESADKGWERVNWLYDEDVDALIDAEMAAEPAVGAA